MDNTKSSRFQISMAAIKHIAYISMLVDHFFLFVYLQALGGGQDIYYQLGRSFGRIAFVLFAFMVSRGMLYSKNRLGYIRNLFVFALVSEIPYDLVNGRGLFEFGTQNVLFTLTMGALVIYVLIELKDYKKLSFLLVLGILFLSYFLRAEYNIGGVILIILFYIFRYNPVYMAFLAYPAFMLSYGVFGTIKNYGFNLSVGSFINRVALAADSESWGIFSIIPIALYGGDKGRSLNKWVYYSIYPLHLMLIYLIIKK